MPHNKIIKALEVTEEVIQQEFLKEFNKLIKKYKEKNNSKFRGVIGTIVIVGDNKDLTGYPFINVFKTSKSCLNKAFQVWLEASHLLLTKINSILGLPSDEQPEENIQPNL